MKKKILLVITCIGIFIITFSYLLHISKRINGYPYTSIFESDAQYYVTYPMSITEDLLIHYASPMGIDYAFDKNGNLVYLTERDLKSFYEKTPSEGDIREYLTERRVPTIEEMKNMYPSID